MSKNKNRQVYTPKVLEPPVEEYEALKEELIKHYALIPRFKGDPEEKAVDVLEKCKVGWRNCPKTFVDRVRSKAKWRHAGGFNMISYGAKAREKSGKKLQSIVVKDKMKETGKGEKEILQQVGREQIIGKLKKRADKNFWIQRERFYRKEFDFNESSDFALLMELLSDELEHRRIVEMRLTTDNPEDLAYLSKAATECFNRLEKAQKALGITREQRKDELDDSEGNVASLAASLEKKIAMKEQWERDMQMEEDEYLSRKATMPDTFAVEGLPRPVHNRIPDLAKIAKMEKDSGVDTYGA